MDDKRRWLDTRVLLRMAIVLSTLVTLSGCGTLVSKKFDTTQTQLWVPLEGVPFSLNKPKLSVTRTPGADGAPATYILATAWEPDPQQQYVLKLRPGLLSSVDWSMSYDSNGVLTDTSAKTTDQSATFIAALGSIAATGATLGFFALHLDLDGGGPPKVCDDDFSIETKRIAGIRDVVDSGIQQDHKLWDIDKQRWVTIPPARVAAQRKASTIFWDERVRTASCSGQLGSFVYADREELQLLQTAFHLLIEQLPPDTSSVDAVLGDAKVSAPVRQIAFQIKQALTTYDTARLDAIKTSLLKARANLNAEKTGNIDADVDAKIADNDTELQLAFDAIDSGFSVEEALLLKAITLKAADWQARRLSIINDDIAQLQQLRRIPMVNKDALGQPVGPVETERVDAQLIALRRQKALILGVLPEFDRLLLLQNMLLRGEVQTSTKTALEEIDYLNKQIAAAEAAGVAAKTPPKPDDPLPASYLVSKCHLESDDIVRRLDALVPPGRRPEYVVVYNPVIADPAFCKGLN